MKITILGGGPGGYEAAIYAAKKGAEVTLIEKDKVGGTCLNRGCIPTKALLACCEVYETVRNSHLFGVMIDGELTVDYPAIIERKNKIASSLEKGIRYLLDKNGVTYLNGFGKCVDRHTIEVTEEDGSIEYVQTDYIILATGSEPVIPTLFEYDGKRMITSDELLDMDAPESIIIIGGGVIGCEIGQFLAKTGTHVTIVESEEQILPSMDPDAVKQLVRQFKKDKISLITGDSAKEVVVSDNNVRVRLHSEKELEASYLLLAVGRKPFIKGAGLKELGIALTQSGHVTANEYLQTSIDNIYAIGDIIDTPMLAHVASKEGWTAVDNIISEDKTMLSYHAVPDCVYTDPQIACVGMNETNLKEECISYTIGRYDFKALGKAQADGKPLGFVKVIADKNDVIIGATIVGTGATDLLQVLTTATQLRLTARQVGDCMFPHPTMSEAVMEALHDLHGESIHKV